ncbi:MAG: 4a-hydroxytetrahydrobiopterin dehydratase [Acidimicrobiales bacterium]
MERLDDATIGDGLAGLDWERQGDALVKTLKLADFKAALAFVNRVGDLAEERNHHPDIAISWNRVTLTLFTHDVGGLTRRDLDLAAEIDRLPSP